MPYLILVSLIWAFSFGLIKTYLTGLDPFLVSGLRMGVALLVFLPFLRMGSLTAAFTWKFLLIGAVQFGVMYGAYIYAYQFMEAHKIALFTVTTPLLVTLIDDLVEKRFQPRFLGVAILSVFGAVVIYYKSVDLQGTLMGIVLIQFSNLCFALGQVFYRRMVLAHPGLRSRDHFAVLYLGGLVATAVLMMFGTDFSGASLSGQQLGVIVFLGALASGVGFFLWNYGATQTNAGSLAVMNNLKIPLAVLVSLLFFEDISTQALTRLSIGGAIIIGAVILNERLSARATRGTP